MSEEQRPISIIVAPASFAPTVNAVFSAGDESLASYQSAILLFQVTFTKAYQSRK
jgi:hypothetical protein